MAFVNLDSYLACVGADKNQNLDFSKTVVATSVAGGVHTVFDRGAYPYQAVTSAGNTANGVVPTSALQGYPYIKPITGTGYLTGISSYVSQVGAVQFYDDVFNCGAYAFNTNTTLTAQPSYVVRIPSANYAGTEIWVQAVTAFTGNLSVNITYTNQDGVTGRTAGVQSVGVALIVGRMYRCKLQDGDYGVQKIESIVGSVATAGTFNVHVMRPIYLLTNSVAYASQKLNLFKTGCPIVYQESAIHPLFYCSTTTTPIMYAKLEISDM